MQKLKRAVIKEEYIAITGDFEKAVILNQFIYWSERVNDFDVFIKQENDRAIKNGYTETDFLNGWIYKTAEELSQETMLGLSVATIRKHIAVLIELGFIDERTNPKYKWDRTKQCRVNLVNIAQALYDKGFPFEDYKIQLRFLENKNGSLEIENRTFENENTIPYTTTKTTLEITNKNNTPLSPIGEDVFNVVQHWNNQNIIKHNKDTWLNDKRNNLIKKVIKEYGVVEVLCAISNYAEVLKDEKYTLFKYTWNLEQFLKQSNALADFTNNGVKWLNYCNWLNKTQKSLSDPFKAMYERYREEESN